MPSEITKEMRCVVAFLSGLGLIILGSIIIDKDIKDILYLIFLVISVIRYVIICRKYYI